MLLAEIMRSFCRVGGLKLPLKELLRVFFGCCRSVFDFERAAAGDPGRGGAAGGRHPPLHPRLPAELRCATPGGGPPLSHIAFMDLIYKYK